ncbi:hypothetical protein N7478_004851 [Penicillium angulare]|uniref:uncharacterized protein n=1 Tax=Penicillium angulare TaxID=116970 RepID=UPI002541FDD6|nr:uncharacterized protein N7478_004851 [Penicillium angulare]KAJ5279479.1 hypothetical protein N7478_004851 [Penicillium angulare]
MTHYSNTSQGKASTKESAQLNQQCVNLLNEVDAFQALLEKTLRNPQVVEVRQFRSNVNSELKMLVKLEERIKAQIQKSKDNTAEKVTVVAPGNKQAGTEAEDIDSESELEQEIDLDSELEMRMVHALRSSNMPFYQSVWDTARDSCEGLLSMGKRFYWDVESMESQKGGSVGKGGGDKPVNKDKRKSAYVDIVADDGDEWVKVSTISESRLLFEMAKKGWEAESDDESSDAGSDGPAKRTVLRNFDGNDPGDDDDDDEMELIKLARDLRKASNATRERYKHPRVRIVLPKIGEGNVPEIDDILSEIRSYGVQVECKETLAARQGKKDLARLLPQPFKKFTPTLNVDCTLLLAMVSDLSHIKNIPVLPSFHRAIVRQIEVEKDMPLLPSELWPAMGSRDLLCSSEAATRMREIVDLIGTPAEKARMEILLENLLGKNVDRKALVEQFQALSDYHVPEDWALPVRIVDAQPEIKTCLANKNLPSVADDVAEGLSDINYSVFMYGWAAGITTITSNRTIYRQIETTIEKSRGEDEDLEGPDVWVCDTARSLVGKERGRN